MLAAAFATNKGRSHWTCWICYRWREHAIAGRTGLRAVDGV